MSLNSKNSKEKRDEAVGSKKKSNSAINKVVEDTKNKVKDIQK